MPTAIERQKADGSRQILAGMQSRDAAQQCCVAGKAELSARRVPAQVGALARESVVDPDDARAIAGRKVLVFLLDRLCHHRPIEQTESAEGSVETLNPPRHQRAGG